MSKLPIVLSFDVGVIYLSYCLMTKKQFGDKLNWDIIDWGIIDMTNRKDEVCKCGAKAKKYNEIDGITKYYCLTHSKKEIELELTFEQCFIEKQEKKTCCYETSKICGKNSINSLIKNPDKYYCNAHAKLYLKKFNSDNKLKPFKTKNSKSLDFDDVKLGLIMKLESMKHFLTADNVVIENQPSFKNPRMKSIASTLYDYFLIRGVVDKDITKSNINKVKFMSPSNKLKLVSEGDNKLLIKSKEDNSLYKVTKSLGIKYCKELIAHLPDKLQLFGKYKKQDDMADSFLQGAYFITNCI